MQLLAGAEYRGQVLAIQSMVFLGPTHTGRLLVGWVADTAGTRAAGGPGRAAYLVAAAAHSATTDIAAGRVGLL